MGKHNERMMRHYVIELAENGGEGRITIVELGMRNMYRLKDGTVELVKSTEQKIPRKRGSAQSGS